MHSEQALDIYDKAEDTVRLARDYMTAMEQAPPLKAAGLDEQFRLLADFGGHVLAGREAKYGMEFVTWSWDYKRTGVTLGNYFYDDYQAAKEDFAMRSGLVQRDKLFTPEQLAAVYHCIERTADFDTTLTYDQEKALKEMQEKIYDLVPSLREQSGQAPRQTM